MAQKADKAHARMVEARGNLLAAEAEFLTARGWRPGTNRKGEVVWTLPSGDGHPWSQKQALEIAEAAHYAAGLAEEAHRDAKKG